MTQACLLCKQYLLYLVQLGQWLLNLLVYSRWSSCSARTICKPLLRLQMVVVEQLRHLHYTSRSSNHWTWVFRCHIDHISLQEFLLVIRVPNSVVVYDKISAPIQCTTTRRPFWKITLKFFVGVLPPFDRTDSAVGKLLCNQFGLKEISLSLGRCLVKLRWDLDREFLMVCRQ